MPEKALLFGEGKSLVGIVTEPDVADPERPGVVILNAGQIHRVGPNRIHVKLARALARDGFVVLRYDSSGIGDSPPRPDGLSIVDRANLENRASFDLLAAHGPQRFVAFGICSGADKALLAALNDERVIGVYAVDPYNVPSLRRFIFRSGERFLSFRSWMRLLLGRSESWGDLRNLPQMRLRLGGTRRPTRSTTPAPAAFVSGLRQLASRGLWLCLAYSAHSPGYFQYRAHVRHRLRSFPFRERIQVDYFEHSDHIFTLRHNQDELLRLVRRWLDGMPALSQVRVRAAMGGETPKPLGVQPAGP